MPILLENNPASSFQCINFDAHSIEHDHWESFEPSGWKAPSLIGRKFIWGKYDCWSIISDWYLETKKIKLMDSTR